MPGIALDQGLVLGVVGRLVAVAPHDVAPDALVPAMHLVRPHKMHLAGRARRVSVAREVPRNRQHLAWHRVAEVRATAIPGIEARKKGLSRRHADRRRRVGVAEVETAVDHPIQRRRADVRIALDRHDVGAVLVVDQHQDVRLAFRHGVHLTTRAREPTPFHPRLPKRRPAPTPSVPEGCGRSHPSTGESNRVRCQSIRGGVALHPLRGERQIRASSAESGEQSSARPAPANSRPTNHRA